MSCLVFFKVVWFVSNGTATSGIYMYSHPRSRPGALPILFGVATMRARAGIGASADADRVAGDLAQADAQVAGLEAELQVQRRLLLILARSEEHTSELQSLMRISYAVFCLEKTNHVRP